MRRPDRCGLPVPMTVAESWPGNFVENVERDLYVVLLIAAQRTAKGVEQKTLRLINGFGSRCL